MHVESLAALSVKKMKPKSFAPSNQSILPFTASPPRRRPVAWRFAPMLASGTSGRAEAPS
jgi:hypothetical protein